MKWFIIACLILMHGKDAWFLENRRQYILYLTAYKMTSLQTLCISYHTNPISYISIDQPEVHRGLFWRLTYDGYKYLTL